MAMTAVSSRSARPLRRRGHAARQKSCRRCNRPFAICAACDRGHAYCSPGCRAAARQACLRAARRRHRASPEGRLDHRDHQRAYRARVRDHSSRHPSPAATLSADTLTEPSALLAGATRCMVYGRESTWLLPPHWPIRRVSSETRYDHARATRRDSAPQQRDILRLSCVRPTPRRSAAARSAVGCNGLMLIQPSPCAPTTHR